MYQQFPAMSRWWCFLYFHNLGLSLVLRKCCRSTLEGDRAGWLLGFHACLLLLSGSNETTLMRVLFWCRWRLRRRSNVCWTTSWSVWRSIRRRLGCRRGRRLISSGRGCRTCLNLTRYSLLSCFQVECELRFWISILVFGCQQDLGLLLESALLGVARRTCAGFDEEGSCAVPCEMSASRRRVWWRPSPVCASRTYLRGSQRHSHPRIWRSLQINQ